MKQCTFCRKQPAVKKEPCPDCGFNPIGRIGYIVDPLCRYGTAKPCPTCGGRGDVFPCQACYEKEINF